MDLNKKCDKCGTTPISYWDYEHDEYLCSKCSQGKLTGTLKNTGR